MSKKSKEGKQTLAEFSSSLFASHMSVSTNQVYQTNQIVLVCHIMNILLTELGRSVWENLDLSHVYRPHCVQSVLMTSVKILPYRPPARLIRAKYDHMNHRCKGFTEVYISYGEYGNLDLMST